MCTYASPVYSGFIISNSASLVLCLYTAAAQARALWLVGACAEAARLGPQEWSDGLSLAVAYMGVPDLVVSLT